MNLKKYTSKEKTTLIKIKNLYGTWVLDHFMIEKSPNELTSWGNNTTGLLIYNTDGYMSVHFNKDLPQKADLHEVNIFNSILSYAGKYELLESNCLESKDLENNPYANSPLTIKHKVVQASDPQRIGTEQTRFIAYEIAQDQNIYLTLSSSVESFGRGIVRWKKEKTNI